MSEGLRRRIGLQVRDGVYMRLKGVAADSGLPIVAVARRCIDEGLPVVEQLVRTEQAAVDAARAKVRGDE